LGAFSQQLAGIVEFDYTDMGGGEWLFDTEGESGLLGGAGHMTFYEVLNESSYYPALRFNTGNNAINAIRIERMTYADTIGGLATPIVDITNALSISNMRVIEPFCGTGAQAFFSGAGPGGIDFVTGYSGCASGLPSTSVNAFRNLNGPTASVSYNNFPVGISGTGQFFYPMGLPAAPVSAVTSSGGSVPVGTHTYAITAVDVNGRETTIGSAVSVNVSSGSQTVTVTPPALPAGAVGYRPYRDGSLALIVPCSGFIAGAVTYVDTASFTCSVNPPSSNTTAAAGVSSGGIAAYQIKMGNTYADTVAPGTLSANRSQTLPDASGVVPVSSYVNSAYDNFNRASGAIGSNWTVTSGGLNVSSDALIGSNSSTVNAAYYNAGTFSTFGQFGQLEISTRPWSWPARRAATTASKTPPRSSFKRSPLVAAPR
jgi:hypothetical protein